MKNFRQLCATAVLVLVLAIPGFAGGMETPYVPPPPPPPPSTASEPIDTEAPETETSSDALVTDSLTEAALSFVQTVLSLF